MPKEHMVVPDLATVTNASSSEHRYPGAALSLHSVNDFRHKTQRGSWPCPMTSTLTSLHAKQI